MSEAARTKTSPPVPYADDGPADAPPLLLIGGIGTTLEMWDPQLPELAQRFRLLRYDHPGHGRTPVREGPYTIAELAADALSVLDQAEVERADVAGVSIGGMIAQWLAIHAPERVRALVLISSAAKLGGPDFWSQRAELALEQGPAATAKVVVPRWFSQGFQEREPAIVERFVDTLAACDMRGYAGCCGAIGGHDTRESLARVTAPTLVIGGDEDPATGPDITRELAQLIGGARHELVPGAAHLLTVEQPPLAGELIAGHVEAAA